jgi:hypothetical protein
MKRKIELTVDEALMIKTALFNDAEWDFAEEFENRFLAADPANEGAEVAILSVNPDAL